MESVWQGIVQVGWTKQTKPWNQEKMAVYKHGKVDKGITV